MKQSVLAIGWIASSIFAAGGQTTTDAPEFEVASVKPAAPSKVMVPAMLPPGMMEAMGFRGGPGTPDPGRIDYSGVSLKLLLARAYEVRPDQISGPGWLDTERYDIVAKVPPATDAARLRLMLQKLLSDRFQIRLHREARTMQVYLLTVAKNGPKVKPAEVLPEYKDDAERMAAAKAQALASLAAMRRNPEASPGRFFHLPRATTAKLAEVLSSHLDHRVQDRTQLEGFCAFSLSWSPDPTQPANGGDAAGRPDSVPMWPSLFVAVQEQLGLKLEPAKESLDLLVIDSALKVPTIN